MQRCDDDDDDNDDEKSGVFVVHCRSTSKAAQCVCMSVFVFECVCERVCAVPVNCIFVSLVNIRNGSHDVVGHDVIVRPMVGVVHRRRWRCGVVEVGAVARGEAHRVGVIHASVEAVFVLRGTDEVD